MSIEETKEFTFNLEKSMPDINVSFVEPEDSRYAIVLETLDQADTKD